MSTTSRHFSQNSDSRPGNKRSNDQQDSSPASKKARLETSPVKVVSDRKRLRLEARRKELLFDNNKRGIKRNPTPTQALVPEVNLAVDDAAEDDYGGTAISALFTKAEVYKPMEMQVCF